MKCPKCDARITPFARDCGRHEPPRQQRVLPVSPWVKRATSNTLPTKDLTGRF
jgi:hypothetical protein